MKTNCWVHVENTRWAYQSFESEGFILIELSDRGKNNFHVVVGNASSFIENWLICENAGYFKAYSLKEAKNIAEKMAKEILSKFIKNKIELLKNMDQFVQRLGKRNQNENS